MIFLSINLNARCMDLSLYRWPEMGQEKTISKMGQEKTISEMGQEKTISEIG